MRKTFVKFYEFKEYMVLHHDTEQDYEIKLSAFAYQKKGFLGNFKDTYNQSAEFSQRQMADEEKLCLDFFQKYGITYEAHEETSLTEPIKISGEPVSRRQHIVHRLWFSVSPETVKKVKYDDAVEQSQKALNNLIWRSGEWYKPICESEVTKEICVRITEDIMQRLDEAKKEDPEAVNFSISIKMDTLGYEVGEQRSDFSELGYEYLQYDLQATAVAAVVAGEAEKKLRAYPSVCDVFLKEWIDCYGTRVKFTVEFFGNESAQPNSAEKNLKSW